MTLPQDIAVVAGVCILIGYPIFMRLLAEWSQPSRLRMVDIGNELLANPYVSSEHKKLINSMLDSAYNPAFMVFVAITMPWFGMAKIFRRTKPPHPPITNEDIRQLDSEFCRRFIESVAAANPAFTVLAALEMAALAMVLFPLGQLWRAQDVQFGTVQAVDRQLQAVDRLIHRRAA